MDQRKRGYTDIKTGKKTVSPEDLETLLNEIKDIRYFSSMYFIN